MPADNLYQRSREDLLQYEDALFNSLILAMANFYSTRNDQNIWGAFLRAVSIEMSRLEYSYAYGLVAKSPEYLTPPDIKRQYADALQVRHNYPQPTQFDIGDFSQANAEFALQYPVGYRDMLLDLLAAYQQGAKVGAITDIIYAYTGKTINIQEFFKDIPLNGVSEFYDASYRNTIGVRVMVGGDNPLSDIQNINQLQQITQSLYSAMDLAKPAHVGLEFSAVFGAGENIDTFINPRFLTNAQRNLLSTTSQGYYQQIGYAPVLDTMYTPTLASLVSEMISIADYTALTPTQQQVGNGYQGIYQNGQAWVENTPVAIGQWVIDAKGYFQMVVATPHVPSTYSGTTAYSGTQGKTPYPVFSTVTGSTIADGVLDPTNFLWPVTWQCLGSAVSVAFAAFGVVPNTALYGIDDNLKIIMKVIETYPFNPMLYQAPIRNLKNPQTTLAAWGLAFTPTLSVAGWIALAPTAWSPAVPYTKGVFTKSGTTVYKAKKASLDVIPSLDTKKTTWAPQACPFPQQAYHFDGTNYVIGIAPWAPVLGFFTGQLMLDPNGYVQLATSGGTTGSSFEAANFSTKVGSVTTDGSVVWQCLGINPYTDPAKWIRIVDKNGVPTGEVSNWDSNHPYGLVAPRESVVWEISGDSFSGDIF